jgi:Protein of unknown function (DUF3108)
MRKNKILILFSLLLLISSFVHVDVPYNAPLSNTSFKKGEELTFKIHYGFVNAARAVFKIDNSIYRIGDKTCYRIEVEGKTIGSFDFFTKVRDRWGTFVDTATMIPEKSYRTIKEGKYDLKESVSFFQDRGIAVRKVDDTKREQYDTPRNVHDIVSGYYYIRSMDFTKLRLNDTIKVLAFFENKNFDFRMKYLGKAKIDTDQGKFSAIVLSPIMPPNDLFSGENSVKLWISDDKNKIPLKCKTSTILGSIDVDLESYSGLRYPLSSKISD